MGTGVATGFGTGVAVTTGGTGLLFALTAAMRVASAPVAVSSCSISDEVVNVTPRSLTAAVSIWFRSSNVTFFDRRPIKRSARLSGGFWAKAESVVMVKMAAIANVTVRRERRHLKSDWVLIGQGYF